MTGRLPPSRLAECERSEEEERGHKKEEGEGSSLRGLDLGGVDASQMSPLGPTALLVSCILLAAVYDLVISPTFKCAQQKFLSCISCTRGWGAFCQKQALSKSHKCQRGGKGTRGGDIVD